MNDYTPERYALFRDHFSLFNYFKTSNVGGETLKYQELDDLYRYANLPIEIKLLEARKEYYHWEFYQQSFHTGVVFSGHDIRSQAIKADKAVIELLEKLRVLDEHIEVLVLKQKYWNDFLTTLSDKDVSYIRSRFSKREVVPANKRVDGLALEEISEIETAVNFQTGRDDLVTGKYKLRTGDFMSNIDEILSMV